MTSPDLDSLEKDIKVIHLHYSKMIVAKKHWSIKPYNDARQKFWDALHEIVNHQQLLEMTEDDWLSNIQQQIQSSDYPHQVETLLQQNGISFSGQFPDYQMPPFKLSFSFSKNTVKLSMGRKSYQTHILEPQSLVEWISQHHRSLLSSSFAHEQFCKEIMSAYKYLSHSNWRRQISIKDVYQLLTIKKSTKQDYPEENFMFDLSRLLRLTVIEYEGFFLSLLLIKSLKKIILLPMNKVKIRRLA